jgi:hypothetical protein
MAFNLQNAFNAVRANMGAAYKQQPQLTSSTSSLQQGQSSTPTSNPNPVASTSSAIYQAAGGGAPATGGGTNTDLNWANQMGQLPQALNSTISSPYSTSLSGARKNSTQTEDPNPIDMARPEYEKNLADHESQWGGKQKSAEAQMAAFERKNQAMASRMGRSAAGGGSLGMGRQAMIQGMQHLDQERNKHNMQGLQIRQAWLDKQIKQAERDQDWDRQQKLIQILQKDQKDLEMLRHTNAKELMEITWANNPDPEIDEK